MSTAPDTENPEGLIMVPPDEAVAVARSRPTPTGGHLVASGLTDAVWSAFIEALSED